MSQILLLIRVDNGHTNIDTREPFTRQNKNIKERDVCISHFDVQAMETEILALSHTHDNLPSNASYTHFERKHKHRLRRDR